MPTVAKKKPETTPAERTMREEGWVLSEELLQDLPPAVVAFKTIYDSDWDIFADDITDNPALKFFNAEQGEFSAAENWTKLCLEQGIAPYHDDWAIPSTICPEAHELCRQIRLEARMFEYEDLGGCKAFHDPRELEERGWPYISSRCILVVHHDGGALSPFFNWARECPVQYRTINGLLEDRKMYREAQNQAETAIFFTDRFHNTRPR